MKHTLSYLLLFAICVNAQVVLEYDPGYYRGLDWYANDFGTAYAAFKEYYELQAEYETQTYCSSVTIYTYSDGNFTSETTFHKSVDYHDVKICPDFTGDNFPEIMEFKMLDDGFAWNACGLKMWDIKTNQCLLSLEGDFYAGYLEYGDFDRDGKLNFKLFVAKDEKDYYRTVIYETNGNATLTNARINLPQKFHLKQNYPNPFNPSTTIEFDIDQPQRVNLEIYDMTGRKVKTIMERRMPAGRHELQWDGTDDRGRRVASGQYFYKLQSDKQRDVKKMLLIK